MDDPATRFKFLTIHDMAAEGAFVPGQLLWELALEPTWRVIVSPVVGGSQVFFGATRVERDTTMCTLRFFSQLQSLDITSGLGVESPRARIGYTLQYRLGQDTTDPAFDGPVTHMFFIGGVITTQ